MNKTMTRLQHVVVAAIIAAQVAPPVAFADVVPPPDLLPLNQIVVPEPPNLFQFVKNKPAAIRLGKALFWEMQAGSDGVQACASCHFSAGADTRTTNTINPGTRGGDTTFQVRGPNQTLQPSDFPFHQRQNPDFQTSSVIRDANDVVGSQGVLLADFVTLDPASPQGADVGNPVADPIFQVNGVNMRRVTARNAPTTINAVFNFNNFWDGRAHFIFNGVNPFGPLDTTAGIWFNENRTLVKRPVAIEFASLASQATGPPLDETEMSFRGRTFPHLARKLLDDNLTPLGKQLVHPNDSVLGPLSNARMQNGKIVGSKGLSTKYRQMVMEAFQDNLWNSTLPTIPNGSFSQMEMNFSLFWGLAIQLYEATLVADQTPFDRFLGGDQRALTEEQQRGFSLFFGAGRCNVCHAGTELTNASVRGAAFVTNAVHGLIEQMPVASGREIIYDIGYNNTATRPSTEDAGRGGRAPFTNSLTGQLFPLAFSLLAELQAANTLPFQTPILPSRLPSNYPTGVNGSFKVPGLRNVELTAPYFHNGGTSTLDDTVRFYVRGGDFPAANRDDLDVAIDEIGHLQGAVDRQQALVSFLMSLTDERVRKESAPFDHPELFIPNGTLPLIKLPAMDANGIAAPSIAVTLDDVTRLTRLSTQVIRGSKESGATVEVTINGGPAVAASTTDTGWSAAISGLAEGANTVTVTGTDTNGVATAITATITVDTTPPLITVVPPASPSRGGSQIIAGTTEPGVHPVVNVSTTATIGPVSISGTSWNCQLSGLVKGNNVITVSATDAAGNSSSATTLVTVVLADGDFSNNGTTDLSDALRALRISLGIIQPTPLDLLHGDVAPMVLGAPAPDGKIDLADTILILRKVAGLAQF